MSLIPRTRTPSKWTPQCVSMAYRYAILGATDRQIAEFLEISPDTVDLWKRTHPEFSNALRRGKAEADARQAESLYLCGMGYEYEEDVVTVYKGTVHVTRVKKYAKRNAWAAYKWLSLRQRQLWHDTQQVDINNTNINRFEVDLSGLSTEDLVTLKRISQNQSKALDAHDD